MTFQLVCIEPKELTQYKADMQEAFQKGFEDAFGKTDAVILPEKDIDQSLNAEGSAVYKAVVDGEMVGGAVVIINESTQHNHLDLLFVKNGVQSNGIGKKIWFELERIYPNTKVWETCTPYFELTGSIPFSLPIALSCMPNILGIEGPVISASISAALYPRL